MIAAQYKTREKQGASESTIRVPIYHMFCQLSNSYVGKSRTYIKHLQVHVNQKDFLCNKNMNVNCRLISL